MIAAAAAAMIGGVQAVTHVETKGHWEKTECGKEWVCGAEGCGTAHKVAISLKTTANKGKTTKVVCQDAACTYWRQQATKKINGLIWEQLDDCTGCVPFGANSTFWTADGALDVEFAIGVGMIGQGTKSKKIEAYGSLAGDDFGALSWAGFGNMAGTYKAGKEIILRTAAKTCSLRTRPLTARSRSRTTWLPPRRSPSPKTLTIRLRSSSSRPLWSMTLWSTRLSSRSNSSRHNA